MKSRPFLSLVLVASSLLCQQSGWCQDARKEHTSVSKDQLKKILDGLKYDYQVKEGTFVVKLSKPGDNKIKYDVIVESFDKGRSIVVAVNFLSIQVPVENGKQAAKLLLDVNDWNIAAALSRGMRRQTVNTDGKQVFYARLEADLDCSIGVTEQDVNRLIQRFPAVLKEFEEFLR